MLVVEPDHMGASSPVEAQKRSQITNYVTMLMTLYGGTLSILQRKFMSNLGWLFGMDPLHL